MNRKALAIGGVFVAAVAAGAIWWFSSTGIDNPVDVTAPTLAPGTTDVTGGEAPGTTAGGAPATTTDDTTGDTATAGGGEAVTYELGDGTVATFELDEELNGSPKRVVATNTEVAGQLRVDTADVSTAELGTIVIGAQTFATDSGNRDRAIRGPILDSDTFQTIEFVPTNVEGLAGAVAPGDTVDFNVTGDLTVRDVTTSVTFAVSATFAGGSIEGSAQTTVLRSDYGLEIPSVPIVANVGDEVLVRIDFVATAIG